MNEEACHVHLPAQNGLISELLYDSNVYYASNIILLMVKKSSDHLLRLVVEIPLFVLF